MCSRDVIKLGGSVLRCKNDYDHFAQLIIEKISEPSLDRLYVVVSAAKGITDFLIKEYGIRTGNLERLRQKLKQNYGSEADSSADYDNPETAFTLLRGEIESATALRMALYNKGIKAKLVTQSDYFPIVSTQGFLHARVDLQRSQEHFRLFEEICQQQRIVIISGFGAVDRSGQPSLLGRNATDYVAALISYLDKKVSMTTFVKDVGGYYEDYNTSSKRLVTQINATNLSLINFNNLLDQRVLNVIRSPFCFADRDLNIGTFVKNVEPVRV